MKSISKYLQKLYEEKLIAKEDGEGGAAPGGDVGGGVTLAPDAEAAPSDEVSGDGDSSKTGLVTTDVFGRCDHKKDGFFGPGCFHLPRCVWSVPCYRYPRKKKRKKLKYSNIVTETDDFTLFERDVQSVIEHEIELAQKYLDQIDPELDIGYDGEYEFGGEQSDWVATLVGDQDDTKTIRVAFNLRALYEFLFDQGLEMDDKEIELQIKVSLWHEIAHALIAYLRDQELFDMDLSEIEEEKMAEEFAKYQIKRYSEVYKSELNDFINEIFFDSKKVDEEEKPVDETRGTVLTDFQHPINLADPHRILNKSEQKMCSKKFIVSDIEIPGEANLFRNQNGKDVTVGINRHGLMALMTPIIPKDKDEEYFMGLPKDEQNQMIDIIVNTQKYIDNPKDNFELEVAADFENATPEEKQEMYDKYTRLKSGVNTLWYKPTLIDVIRVCKTGGVNYLPVQTLDKIDEHDNDAKMRYIESLNESISHVFVKDMYNLQRTKQHFAPDRWYLLTKDFKDEADLGFVQYIVKLQKKNGIGTNYIFSSGVLFGYDEADQRLQTVYYIEPCEVVYMLMKGEILHGERGGVSMRLLWRCLQNIMQKKAFAGHFDRRKGY